MPFFKNAIQSILDRTPEGYRPCYRCSVCRMCKGKGKTNGGECPACTACKKCEGTRLVPDDRMPAEDAEVILTRVNIMKRPMLEHVAMFLANQAEGDVVFERLFDKRTFRVQSGELVRIRIERISKKDAQSAKPYQPNIEEEADSPPEVPEEAPL